MKTLLISTLTAVLALTSASAQVGTTTTTTTTTSEATQFTTANGTITTFAPGQNMVVQETTGPVTYIHNPNAAYVFKGVVLTPAEAQARIRAGLPVKVEYAPQGNTRVVKRIIVDEDAEIEIDEDDGEVEVEVDD